MADTDDPGVAEVLATLLVRRLTLLEDRDGLRALADAGDESAAEALARLLTGRSDLEEAELVLRGHADNSWGATRMLADMLAARGDAPEAAQIPHDQVDLGDVGAAGQLRELLVSQGRQEEAERLGRLGLEADGSIARALR